MMFRVGLQTETIDRVKQVKLNKPGRVEAIHQIEIEQNMCRILISYIISSS